MKGQKLYSLKDKHDGKSREDVRVPEAPATVKGRLALMKGGKKSGKKKTGAVRRAVAKITKKVTEKE